MTVLHIVKTVNETDITKSDTTLNRLGSNKAQQSDYQQVEEYLKNKFMEDFLSDHIRLQVIESNTPLDAVIKIANQGYDLIVVGMSETWGMETSLFSRRHQRLAVESPASILIVRKYGVSK